MLRIKGQAPPELPIEPQVEAEAPLEPELPIEPEVEPQAMLPMQADPMVAGYKGPEMGPFMCSTCMFWQEPESCALVSGPISPDGLCNLHSPMAPQAPPEGMEEPLPVDEPTEVPEEPEVPME